MVQMLGWSRAEAAWASWEEPLLGRRVSSEIGRKELDGDRSFEARVGGLIDHAHPALAELGHDGIRAELGAGGQGHRGADYICGRFEG